MEQPMVSGYVHGPVGVKGKDASEISFHRENPVSVAHGTTSKEIQSF
jgi:hypothetical protein